MIIETKMANGKREGERERGREGGREGKTVRE